MPACYVTNCPNRTNKGLTKLKYVYFPKDLDLRAAWLDALGKNEKDINVEIARICEQHFENDCFEEKMTKPRKSTGRSGTLVRKLKPRAVPTKLLNLQKAQKSKEHCLPVKSGKYTETTQVCRVPTYNELVAYFNEKNNKERIVSTGHTQLLTEVHEVSQDQLTSDFPCNEEVCEEHVSNMEEERNVSSDKSSDKLTSLSILSDSSHRDHDYLGTKNKTSEFLITDNGEKPLEDAHSQVLENVKKELCRICGKKGDALMSICETSFKSFKHMADEMPLSAKIEIHLPLKVEKDDILPLHICWTCADLLTRWHELYVTCVAADAVLRKTFGVEETAVPLDTSGLFSTSQDKSDLPLASNLSTPEEMHYEIDHPPALNVNEKYKGICEKCGKSCCGEVEDEQEFQEIFRNSVNRPSLLCKICCESFKSTIERRNHFIMCRQQSTICEICGEEVQHRKDLTRHKNRKHSNKIKIVTKRHMCDKCAKCFRDCSQLKIHMAVHERDRTPRHFCNLCCKTFYNHHNYEMHMKKHEEGKIPSTIKIQAPLANENVSLYMCPVCQQTFEDPLSLAIHLTFKKEMKCPMCHKKIFNERLFILHKCKVYNCQYCCKSFNTKFAYENHERIHTREKPYKCNICDSMFRTVRLKVQHEKAHNLDFFKSSYWNKKMKSKCVFQGHKVP